MTDDHANELKCTWSAEDKIDELEGKTILIESGRDKKDQLAGIKKEIKNKNGKRYETVKLDDRCAIRKMNGEATPEPEPIDGSKFTREFVREPDWPETAPISNPKQKHSVLDERQRAIIRQHSQSMALEVLKLKVTLNELTVADLTPSKLKTLAEYFDNDVLEAAQ